MKLFALSAAALTVALLIPACAADWPARIFAPYLYLGAARPLSLTQCAQESGQKYFTLAFIVNGESNNPAWDGVAAPAVAIGTNEIAALRSRGGDVIVSFGGEAGVELAMVTLDTSILSETYQSIVDRYQLTWLDFDVEGDALANLASNQRRNTALAALQARNPGLIISYTLPVDPNGISADATNLLADAKAKGLRIHSANLMTMDFGRDFSEGRKMSDVAIASTLMAHEQIQLIDPNIQIGLTPDIGQNDVKSEIFTLADARALRNWAVKQSWICSLSFWSCNRDTGMPGKADDDSSSGLRQKPWAFTRIFQTFQTP
jgi:hypothetical protein